MVLHFVCYFLRNGRRIDWGKSDLREGYKVLLYKEGLERRSQDVGIMREY